MRLLDIHSHLLPGIDDGPASLEKSLEIARAYVGNQIQEVILTPHFEEGLYENFRDRILKETVHFQKKLEEAGIPLIVYPGAEVMITPSLPELVQKGKIMTLNDKNRFILLEMPLSQQPLYVEDVIYELKMMGLEPIIAHPERYRKIDPHILEENYLQMNLCSFSGYYGNKVEQRGLEILKNTDPNCIFYGTDTHTSCNKLPGDPDRAKLARNVELL